MHQKPRVPRGKSIKKGEILAEGAATVGGELALGKNVLVAYAMGRLQFGRRSIN
jgi:DNA-directed RNA polymerase subunit beta